MPPDKNNYHILVVDDEPEMRNFIADYLADVEGYSVCQAEGGREALDNVLSSRPIDLIVSDINMPGMKGFDLLKEVRRRYPAIKRVLITAYNVEDYLELALKHDVGNVFIKTVPFNFRELSVVINNLRSNDIFGIEKYFDEGVPRASFLITRGRDLEDEAKRVVQSLPVSTEASRLELVVFEILTNAVFYGIRGESPECKDRWNYDFELSAKEAIAISVMHDPQKYAVAIVDNGGRLKKTDVLYWLHRQIAATDVDIPIGLFDTHGRGFFIARKYVDRVIINIERGRKTEIILMNYSATTFSGYKPLYINEI